MEPSEIRIRADISSFGSEAMEALRQDLGRYVGPTKYDSKEARPGAKGGLALDMGTLVVALLGTPGAVALVSVLKSYLDREAVTEIEVSGPGGSAKLKVSDRGRVSTDDIRKIVHRVLGTEDV